jgi:hypothetical protein
MTNKKEEAQKVMDEFYFTFVNERQDFFIQKLNNIAIANALRELVNQLQQSPGVVMCYDILELCNELEEL